MNDMTDQPCGYDLAELLRGLDRHAAWLNKQGVPDKGSSGLEEDAATAIRELVCERDAAVRMHKEAEQARGEADHKAAALDALEAWLRGPKNEERTVELSLPYDGRISVSIRRFLLPGCDLSQHDVGYGNDLATAIASALKNKT